MLRRELFQLLRLAASAALIGTLAIVALRVGIGYDLFASYKSVRLLPGGQKGVVGWFVVDPLGWATGAGSVTLALAALGVKRVAWPLLLFIPLIAFSALPSSVTRLVPGELERTWLFTYPLFAIMAGAALAAWHRRSVRQRATALGALLALSIGQAVVLEALVYNWW